MKLAQTMGSTSVASSAINHGRSATLAIAYVTHPERFGWSRNHGLPLRGSNNPKPPTTWPKESSPTALPLN